MDGNSRPDPEGSFADMGAYEHILGAPVGIENAAGQGPQKFALYQNYPNPFNPVTTISYTVGAHREVAFQNVELSIYNCLGQKVTTLVSKKQPAGIYSVEWDASGLSSGVYLYRLQTGTHVQTKKMILMK